MFVENRAQRQRHLDRLSSELVTHLHLASQSRTTLDTLSEALRGRHSENDSVQKLLFLLLGGRNGVEKVLGQDDVATPATTTSATDSYSVKREPGTNL